jgi:membrane protein YqaA with SNARE-associated domain
MKILRKIYDWTLNKASHPKATWFLSLISFTESSFFPIPPDIILIPMIIAKRLKAWWYAFICTVSSVIGGIVGYYIGAFFYSTIGIIILKYYSLGDQFSNFESLYNENGMWIVLGAGFTPFPFKFITIASGFFHLNIFLFIIVALIARGSRFYLIAILLRIFGDWIKNFIDKYFNLLAILFFILLIGSFIFVKYL